MQKPLLIDALFAPGCGSRDNTLEVIDQLVNRLSITANIRVITVDTIENAIKLRFLGSPSVLVNGEDIEPGSAERKDFGLG